MKTKIIILSFLTISLLVLSFKNISTENGKEPWTKMQLMEPAEIQHCCGKGSFVVIEATKEIIEDVE